MRLFTPTKITFPVRGHPAVPSNRKKGEKRRKFRFELSMFHELFRTKLQAVTLANDFPQMTDGAFPFRISHWKLPSTLRRI